MSLLSFYNKSERNDNDLKKEYERRKQNSVDIPLYIKTKGSVQEQLYFNYKAEHIKYIKEIMRNVGKLDVIVEKEIKAIELVMNEIVKKEIESTNKIENIQTKRKNIIALQKNIDQSKRVDEYKLVKLYQQIIEKGIKVESKLDISEIYKNLLSDYLKEEDKILEGFNFRHDSVGVVRGEKIIHEGEDFNVLENELENLLKFMAEENDIDMLIKVAIFHFYFGYLHPFFDGNGRINRFLSCYYLSGEIGNYGLLLSNEILSNRDDYYQWFENAENQFNHGDLNEFIDNFLKIYHDMTAKFLKKTKDITKKVEEIQKKIDEKISEKNTNKMLKMMIKEEVFDRDNITTRKELALGLEKGETAIREMTQKWATEELIIADKISRTIVYRINYDHPTIKEILDDE